MPAIRGNYVFVILEDANIEKAVEIGAFCRLHVAGQALIWCCARLNSPQKKELILASNVFAIPQAAIRPTPDNAS